MISWGIPSFLAMLAAPSTNQSAPFTRKIKPTNKIQSLAELLINCTDEEVNRYHRQATPFYEVILSNNINLSNFKLILNI